MPEATSVARQIAGVVAKLEAPRGPDVDPTCARLQAGAI